MPDLIPLSDLPSAATVAPSTSRADPYHDRLWPSGVGGATVAWAGRGELEAWGNRFPMPRKASAEAYFAHDRARRVTALAALQMWRLATTEQLAALTGDARWLSPSWPQSLLLALGANLVQVGRFALAEPSRRRHFDLHPVKRSLPALVRPLPDGLEAAEGLCSYSEWLAISGGRPWASPVGYNRHGVLATEASLRVAEHLPVAAVFGETMADLASMLGLGTWRRADAAWARPDGLVLAVEVVAAASTGLPAKAAWWADALARATDEPVVLLFLVASPATTWGRAWQHDVRECVARAAFGSFDAVSAKVANRVAVAYWEDWWPQKGFASPAFLSLRAARPTGPRADDPWEPLDLFDPFAQPGPPQAGPVLANAAFLGGMPHWLRRQPPAAALREALWASAGLGALLAR
jgi:hypothetical protein